MISLGPSADGWRAVFTSGGGANIVPLCTGRVPQEDSRSARHTPTEDAASAAAQNPRGNSRAWDIENVAVYQQVASV